MAMILTTKICSSCKAELPTSKFGKRPEYRDGYRSECNPCRSAKSSIYARKHVTPASRREAYLKYKSKLPDGSLRWAKLLAKYGISQQEYNHLLAEQNGRCALCLTTTPKGRFPVFVVDHCHETGKIRGLLCSPCNSAIGYLGDTADRLEMVVKYLKASHVIDG